MCWPLVYFWGVSISIFTWKQKMRNCFGGRQELGDGQNALCDSSKGSAVGTPQWLRGAYRAIRELLPFSGRSVKGLCLLSQSGLQVKSLSHKNKNKTTRCFASESSCNTPCGLTSVSQVRKQGLETGWTTPRSWWELGVNLSWFDSRVYNNTS